MTHWRERRPEEGEPHCAGAALTEIPCPLFLRRTVIVGEPTAVTSPLRRLQLQACARFSQQFCHFRLAVMTSFLRTPGKQGRGARQLRTPGAHGKSRYQFILHILPTTSLPLASITMYQGHVPSCHTNQSFQSLVVSNLESPSSVRNCD